MTAFGLSAADSGHFADILAAASSNANTNVSMMGETFKYCAPIAGALGFSAEDTAEAIGLMANSGIKASQAGTSLRSIMNNLAGEVTFAGKNIGEVTIATSNADGSMRSLNDILADCRVAFSGLTESEKAANAESLVGKNAMSGFLALILAPEFFQPLRDLGTFYHAKAQAIGAADSLKTFMETPLAQAERGEKALKDDETVSLEARDLLIKSPEGKVLAGPLNFSLRAGERVVLVGQSGSGKSSLLNTLTGFLPYDGSLKVNGVELKSLDADRWRRLLSWVGQNPQLPAATLRENVLLSCPEATEAQLQLALDKAWVSEFVSLLPQGINTPVGDQAGRLSVGQAQRVAVARALLVPCRLLLLDEPAASLDAHSEQRVMQALTNASTQQTTLMVTHQLEGLANWDAIWVMQDGRIVEQGSYSQLAAAGGPFATLLAHRQEEI